MTHSTMASDALTASPTFTTIGTKFEAEALAEHLRHPGREAPCIVVTTRPGTSEPIVDLDVLRDEVGDDADIYVLPTGSQSWSFAKALPPMTEVYGGALRLYPVGLAWMDDPFLSPLQFVTQSGRGPQRAALRIAELVRCLPRPGVYTTQTASPHVTTVHPPLYAVTAHSAATESDAVAKSLPETVTDLAHLVEVLLVRASRAESELASSRRDAMRWRAVATAAQTARQRAQRRGRRGPTTDDPAGDLDAFAEPEQQFRWEVECAWARRIPAGDKNRLPLQSFTLGPAFLHSVATVGGVDRAKVVDVVVEIVTGLVDQVNGRQLHQLRRAGASTLARGDGATCWRASIQVHTPSARRIHFWRLPGVIELSRVVLHDDMNP